MPAFINVKIQHIIITLYTINIYASGDRDAKLLDAPVLQKKNKVFGDSVN